MSKKYSNFASSNLKHYTIMGSTLYAVQMVEHEMFSRAQHYLIGVFSDRLSASLALEKAFKKSCDTYCVDESLCDETQCDTECSFYNEGKEFSIDYRRNGAIAGEVFGDITEIELNEINIDISID